MGEEPRLPEAIIADVDGTLALRHGRGPYQYDRCDTDLPNRPVIELVKRIGLPVIYLTGREDSCFDLTRQWLDDQGLPYGELYMRASGDHRKDAQIKRELYKRHVVGRYRILFVLDDRDQAVDLWRRVLKLTCLQVAYGDF